MNSLRDGRKCNCGHHPFFNSLFVGFLYSFIRWSGMDSKEGRGEIQVKKKKKKHIILTGPRYGRHQDGQRVRRTLRL